jgi:hypothetical protein
MGQLPAGSSSRSHDMAVRYRLGPDSRRRDRRGHTRLPAAGAVTKFATEAELCRAFLAEVPRAWTAYAETAGWDFLLVRNADGFQIGVQAKLRLNGKVLEQAIEAYARTADWAGPDCRAVLVPDQAAPGFAAICSYIGLTVIRMAHPRASYRLSAGRYAPHLPGASGSDENWHEWCPAKRHKLPEYVPDVAAGVPSPAQLSRWKIKAIKISVTLERRGYVTRADFKHIQLDHRRFLTAGLGWLIPDRSTGRYTRSALWPNMKTMHPRVYGEIDRDYNRWRTPESVLQLAERRGAQQVAML